MAVGIEVLLNRIQVLENAESGDFQSATVVHFSLTWPNKDTPVLQSVKGLKLQDRLEIDYVGGRNPDTQRPYTYSDRVVFKQSVSGRSELVITVTTVEQTPKIAKFLAAIFGTAVGVVFNLAVGGVSNLIFGAVLGSIGERFGGKFVTARMDRTTPIGDAILTIDEKKLPKGPQRITLYAPMDVTIAKLVVDSEDDRAHHVTKQVLHKNQPNGYVEVEVNILTAE